MRFGTRPLATRLLLLIGGVVTTCLSSLSLNAHEIGSTRVSVVFSEAGTYEIDLVTDAGALIEKLQTSGSPTTGLPADRMQDLLASLDATFRQRVAVSFDGMNVRPAIRYSVGPPPDTTSAAMVGIYLLSARARSVLWQVSAFTVAHSITLGLSMFGVLSVSAAIVEPLIALSIAYVAIENIFVSELKSWRVALVFAFGLLHGMGFAGALKELGLPRSEFVTALLTFNLGVEAGQLAVIGAAFLVVGCRFADRGWYRNRIVVPASALIAGTAVYWTIARLAF
jgi:hypothetical protein